MTAALASMLLASCGNNNASSRTPNTSAADNTARVNDAVKPPRAYYDALLADRMLALDQNAISTTQVLWLNFKGATVQKGYNRDQSFIPCNNQSVIPDSGLSPADQKVVADKTAQFFSNAGVHIELTFDKPTSGDFTTMHIGGRYSNLGCLGGGSVLGISPLDDGNSNPNDVGFAFIPQGQDLQTLAETVAHESGHTFGLDHVTAQTDLMYFSSTSQIVGFQNSTLESGGPQDAPTMLQKALGTGVASVTGTPVAPNGNVPTVPVTPSNPSQPQPFPNMPSGIAGIFNLPGLSNLGGLNQLFGQLSPNIVSSLSGIIPQIGQLPGGAILQNPTSVMSLMTVLQNVVAQQNGGQINISQLSSLISGTGGQAPQLSTLLSMIGMSGANPAAGISSLLPMILPKLGAAAPATSTNAASALPLDFAALMGMSTMTNPAQLIALIPQYSQLIQCNASGGQSAALMDVVKLAITQQYKTIP